MSGHSAHWYNAPAAVHGDVMPFPVPDESIVHFLNVPESKVTSIPWGVNREMFYPIYDGEYLERVGIKGLYYFSSSANHPRKNLPLLLQSYRKYLELGGVGQLVILNPELRVK